jgi:DNA-binding NarL/FixJ family response regulator
VTLAAWGAVAGMETGVEVDADFGGPLLAMVERDWRCAADEFAEIGWPYERALMLSLLDDPDALADSLEGARRLGAVPLERRVIARMRALRVPVPRGPRVSTRTNPAGLTTRQLEVLKLLLDGLTNTEIADQLVVSPRTAEHHVAAVLDKLGAGSRREAARRAAELGLN